jgi:hypothetical protein
VDIETYGRLAWSLFWAGAVFCLAAFIVAVL